MPEADFAADWVRRRVHLNQFKDDLWLEEHSQVVSEWAANKRGGKLVLCIDDLGALAVSTALTAESCKASEFQYFAREAQLLTPANINASVQYGVTAPNSLESLLRVMNGVYVPKILKNGVWPEAVKKDFTGQLHKFMASLTESSNEAQGKTVLYLPSEETGAEETAAHDKELVQRLESTVIHWTRQIKEVVSNQDNTTTPNTEKKLSGPLKEIAFWRSRKLDLSGISDQLNRDGVQQIVRVLKAADSSYLPPFEKLSKSIQMGSEEATDNLHFLESLTSPCEQLEQAELEEIPTILPTLLRYIRMIWAISRYYNTEERITGLVRKVSDEIINRCCDKIAPLRNLKEIFDGDVKGSMVTLQQSIACGMFWKELYQKTAEAISAKYRDSTPRRSWESIDDKSIFAQIDAFVQRCRDLLEICEGRVQFARRHAEAQDEGVQPHFGGSRGPEISKSLEVIEAKFEALISRLKDLKYDILDVNASNWHDDYNFFKNGVKDLEVMMQNVINTAFETVGTVADGVALLESFYSLAKRVAIKNCVEKKTGEVFKIFIDECKILQDKFDRFKKEPPLSSQESTSAGSALWARGLREIVKRDWQLLSEANDSFLGNKREAEEAERVFTALVQTLEDFKQATYKRWCKALEQMDSNNLTARLDNPLMKRLSDSDDAVVSRTKSGELMSNFDRPLVSLFNEVFYWEKFGSEIQIPYVAHDICNQKEKLRTLRENVMLVVQDYNKILLTLTAEERRLFSDHLRKLDKRINQGLHKLTWSTRTRGLTDSYVKDCRKHCQELYNIIKNYQEGKGTIFRCCRDMARAQLINIEKNHVYLEKEFDAKQQQHREKIQKHLEQCHKTIKETVLKIYRDSFKEGTGEVQREWRSFIGQIDKRTEKSLRQTVKRSLQELSKAINGDNKTDPQTLFKISVVLQGNRTEFQPTMINLTTVMNAVSSDLIKAIKVVPRLKEVKEVKECGVRKRQVKEEEQEGGHEDGGTNIPQKASSAHAAKGAESFYEIISNDDDTLKVLVQIMNGMSSSATELQKYLSYWDKYKPIWEMDKGAFIRRYAKAMRPLVQYDMDITRYRDHQQDIQLEDHSTSRGFIQIDCTLLKTALVEHTVQWQNKLTALLNRNALEQLQGIHSMFSQTTKKLKETPKDLDQLSDSLGTLHEMQKKGSETLNMFEPLQEMYATLQKFDVQVDDGEMKMLGTMRIEYDSFETMLGTAEQDLARSKAGMKADLVSNLEAFNKHVADLRQESLAMLPFSNDFSTEQASDLLVQVQKKLTSAKERERALIPGLSIFTIQPPDPQEVRDTEKELRLLETIWGISREWDGEWAQWKTGKFSELVVADMEATAGVFNKRIAKLRKEMKSWTVWQAMNQKVDEFRKTMPLITDLKNPAIRPRHWDQLKEEMDKEFDPTSDAFTLEQVFSLGFHLYVDFVGDMSTNATKELAIEQALMEIEERWETIDIELTDYKGSYFKIKSTEDLFTTLEDDAVSLSTMKASKFYASFATKIDAWEGALSLISEVVELILAVQRAWMYLESIFMASEDIQKQLPQETKWFREVNTNYIVLMKRLNADPNAMRSCSQEGTFEMVTEMDSKLERIQKSLDQYLETKRMVFPRFYFLSNDDLLEILGQSKDPMQVQKHVKKCFEGLKLLDLIEPGVNRNRTVEAKGMNEGHGKEAIDFVSNVIIDGPVELWLVEVEKMMQLTLQRALAASLQAYKGKKEKWIHEVLGQLLITTGAIGWTTDCTKALGEIEKGNKNGLRQLKKKQVSYLNRLADMVRGNLSKLDRKKLVCLITMEIHSRDVIERMMKAGCASTQDFEWLKQLRMVFDKDEGQFGINWVKQTNCTLEYSYEYQGNNGRLVVTPLTDRCVLTLNTAMFLNRGGNPLGPAGTGKTETVKDLGKNLAKYVVVINCSDGLDYKSVGRMFSGLVQCGAWGCFDEFNRIEIEVLSVVAMQILSIVNALAQKLDEFSFMGQVIRCNKNCGIFITMNPGYAGRTELPDNLKALMRPVAMMTPDLALIAEVMLSAEGFRESRALAKKTVTLYGLMIQQLSKQDHYDYGLRNLKAVLNCAGALKRADPMMNEEAILMRALRDMNLPKFIADDLRLFKLLLGDLFPSLELPVSEYGVLQQQVEAEFEAKGLQKHTYLLEKTVQLYDSMETRHCNMLVGRTMSGKSVVWNTLMDAKTTLAANEEVEGYEKVTRVVLNAKSVTLNELYGAYDLATFEWADGVLSTVFRNCAQDERPFEKWILFDGPVDTLWIESMNSVMDDNKVLTLINGDRITMSATMALLFEVLDLSQASPATVSRAGMIFIAGEKLGYQPYVNSWLAQKFEADQELIPFFNGLFEKYVGKVLKFKRLECTEPVPITDFNAVQSLCTLYDALEGSAGLEAAQEDMAAYQALAEKWFVFAMVWSVMGCVDEAGRAKLDTCLRDIEAQFPPLHTVYEYYVDVQKKDWEAWDTKVPAWRPKKAQPFHEMIVPTVDTVRNAFVVNKLVAFKKHTLIVGNTGTGKTVLCQSQLDGLPETHSKQVINFSAASTSQSTQEIVESCMEKRSKDKFGPSGGKQLVLFVDDFNMPTVDNFGSQPPLEILRQWMDYSGWYDRTKCQWRYILDTQMLCSMAPPSGGRAVISERTQSRFNLINFTFPVDSQVSRIFESILAPKLATFNEEIKTLAPAIVRATLHVYKSVVKNFLPTPEKSHYLFNLRDVSKVIQGCNGVHAESFGDKDAYLRLWVHESLRVFADRFVQDKLDDLSRFRSLLDGVLKEKLESDWEALMGDCHEPAAGPLFCSFMHDPAHPTYEEVDAAQHPKLKVALEEKLEDYNNEPKNLAMDLVLFSDAIGHVLRIHRVLMQPRGNLMLVGVGGSGRSSLTKVAAYTADMGCFSIEITKQYRGIEFHDDLKRLYLQAGGEGKPTVFLFNDTQIKQESFVEDINNILSSGEVPNLFGKEDMAEVYDSVRPVCKDLGIPDTADNLWDLFVSRTRSNLHVVLAMSPVGPALRNRCRMYPGLVSCTTIDWFHAWPPEALQEVAIKFLDAEKQFAGDSPERMKVKYAIATCFANAQVSVAEASEKMLEQLKRHNYVTPTNYLELVKGYRVLLAEKTKEVSDSKNKLVNGLSKLTESQEQVKVMSAELEVKTVVVSQSQKDCEEMLVVIVSEKRSADEQQKQVEADRTRIGKEKADTEKIAADAQADLDVALPALEKAMKEVDKLDKGAISEIKGFSKPSEAVEMTGAGVMILFGGKQDWATAKKKISETNFLQQVKSFDKDNVGDSKVNKLKKLVANPEFTPESVSKKSVAAGALCTWVCAIHVYSGVAKNVAPKRAKLKAAEKSLASKLEALADAEEKLAAVIQKGKELQDQYDSSTGNKNRLRKEAEDLEAKLDRADKLVSGLSGEYTRWQASIGTFDQIIINLTGDCLVGAAFLSYVG
jgi:dynein heavy chain